MYKNIKKLVDNNNKIDLLSLNNFLIKEGHLFLDKIINKGKDKWVRKEDITKEEFQSNYLEIFGVCQNIAINFDTNISEFIFIGDDFPVEWYTDEIIDELRYDENNDGSYLARLNSNINGYYEICEEYINDGISGALQFIPKTLKNYYNLVPLAFLFNHNIINTSWFPKEYIPRLIKEFPEDSEERKILEKYLLKEYITKEVKNLLREYYLK
jgi:hypothetical protein